MSRALTFGLGFHDLNMRRTDQDRRRPREVVTARLLGDPAPDRLERAEALRLKAKPPREMPIPSMQGKAMRSGGGRS